MTQSKPIFVRFHAHWCGHCLSMKNEMIQLTKESRDYIIKDIEEGDMKHMGSDLSKYNLTKNIRGFPTMFGIIPNDRNAVVKEYSGPRTAKDMHKFMNTLIKKSNVTPPPPSKKALTNRNAAASKRAIPRKN